MKMYLLLAIIFSLMSLSSSNLDDGRSPPTLVTRLIHHHSVKSPYFQPNTSKKDRADFDLKSSMYRAFYLVGNTTSFLKIMDIELELNPSKKGGFMAHIQVGSKNLSQFLYMDTGSSLLWVNCEGRAFNPYLPEPLFKPNESTTFDLENCNDSDICEATGAVPVSCNSDTCTFIVQYADGSYSQGALARDQFVFGQEVLQEIFFGCSYKSYNLFANGVLGLGNDRISVIAQGGYTKFAYCIGDLNDMLYEYNTLTVGDSASLAGPRTPMILDSKYYINLDHIEIGDITLRIDRKLFKREGYNGGMLVDTGSTYTLMPRVAVETFEAVVIDVIANKGKNITRNEFFPYKGYPRVCYDGDVKNDLQWFGNVRLIFEGGAPMVLSPQNIFHQVSEECFCLGVLPVDLASEGATISILGNLMQQNFYVAFDMDSKQVSFQEVDCSIFDD